MFEKIQIKIFTILFGLISLGVSASELTLEPNEKSYLEHHKEITLCVDPNWLPYEKLDAKGRHIGLVAEYMALIEHRLNITFKLVKTASWEETQNLYRKGRCDIVSALNKTAEREQYLNFTQPYIMSPAVLVLDESNMKYKQLVDLSGKKLGMVKGYVYEYRLRKDYPDIVIEYVSNMEAALNKVSTGEIDATLGPLFLTFTLMQKLDLENIKLVGNTEYQDELRIGIKKNNKELTRIFEKVVSSITKADHAMVRKAWSKLQK